MIWFGLIGLGIGTSWKQRGFKRVHYPKAKEEGTDRGSYFSQKNLEFIWGIIQSKF
jgi:hypothetical protein